MKILMNQKYFTLCFLKQLGFRGHFVVSIVAWRMCFGPLFFNQYN